MDDKDIQQQFEQSAAYAAGLEAKIGELSNKVPVLMGTIHALESQLKAVKRAHVTGPGHSGTIENGMMYDPDAAGAGGGSSLPVGISVLITVCVDDGMGGFTQKTATFVRGILTKIA